MLNTRHTAFAFVLALAVLPAIALAEGPKPEPIAEAPEVQGLFTQVDNVYVGGQPTQAALAWLKERGVKTVISLRTPYEMNNRDMVPFDEAAVAGDMGMTLVTIPLGGSDHPYDTAAVDRFARVVEENGDSPIFVHCTVGQRATHMWTAWQVRHKGMELEDALATAQRMEFGQHPLEGLLGTPLTLTERPED